MNYLESKLEQAILGWSAEEVFAAGLFGPPPASPKAVDCVGDIFGTMHKGYMLLTFKEEEKASLLVSSHGGMPADEMEFPWLGFRLDS